jgi:pyruvate kinase
MSRVKLIVTLGPRTKSAEALRALMDAGADVVRLNGSHGDLDWHAEAIALIRQTAPQALILLDLPGRKIRTRALQHEPRFGIGDRIVLTTADGDDGASKVPVSSTSLHEDVSAGDTILADDGQLRFVVEAIVGQDVLCAAPRASMCPG